MKLTKIYVGANNKTHKIELDKIKDVLRLTNGYTIVLSEGYWEGKGEPACIVEILGDYNTGIIPELKRQLKQDSILVVEQVVESKFY